MKTTPRCQMALDYAKESLARFGHLQISSAHLVLGLLTLRGGVGDNVLRKFGFSVEGVEAYLSSQRNQVGEVRIQDGLPLGHSAVSALERAEGEAHTRRHTYPGVEHLVLSILSEEHGEAADLFASVHADRDRMRQMITEEIQ